MIDKKYILLFLVYLLWQVAYTQVQPYSSEEGVVIAPNDNPNSLTRPRSGSVLDIRTTATPDNTQGILLPRMRHDQMIDIAPDATATGLTVFVKEPLAERGIWYFDGTEWVRLEVQTSVFGKVPNGGIIMYAGNPSDETLFDVTFVDGVAYSTGKGKSGTEMEGWRVCNGIGNTPDLRGLFVVGGVSSSEASGITDYQTIGAKPWGKEEVTLSVVEMDMANHKHDINVDLTEDHQHPVQHDGVEGSAILDITNLKTDNDGAHSHVDKVWDRLFDLPGFGSGGEDDGVHGFGSGTGTGYSSIDYHGHQLSGYMTTHGQGTVDFELPAVIHSHDDMTFPDDIYTDATVTNTQAHNNLPPYYVLVYLIRMDEGEAYDSTHDVHVLH